MPALAVPLCGRCSARIRRRERWGYGFGLLVLAVGTVAALAMLSLWPWVSYAGLLWGMGLGCASALFLGVWRLGELAQQGPDGWQGVPGRWLSVRGQEAVLALACKELPTKELESRSIGDWHVTEHDLGWLLVGWALSALVAAPVGWTVFHPPVRLVNVSEQTLRIVVDDRELALVPAIPGESANAGVVLRVPRGLRRWEARAEDGRTVDRVQAYVGLGQAQVYAPSHQGHCFWVEQQSYGTASGKRAGRELLPERMSFYTLSEPIDGWFQPNPAAASKDRWFSGGVRRAFRQGPCASGSQ